MCMNRSFQGLPLTGQQLASSRRTGPKSKKQQKPLSRSSRMRRDVSAFRPLHRRWSQELAGLDDLFTQVTRRFDLSVVGQIEPGKETLEVMLPETALFGSGRPVLVVPYIQKAGMKLNRTLICWDGSRTAARAIGDAMPFLLRTKSIDVLSVMMKSETARNELPGADIAQHLARHNLKVDFKRIVANDQDIGNTILSAAADLGSDMIVMGGYGHSRAREFVLGGATRAVLKAMTVAVLMSH